MLISLNNFKRMVVALSLGLAIVLIQIPSASATVVEFKYNGLDSNTSAFGSFTIDDTLFDGSSSQSILQSNLLSFSFSMTNLEDPATGTWGFGDLLVGSTIKFDSTNYVSLKFADVVGATGSAAGGGSGGLEFAGTGGAFAQSAFGSIDSADGDWDLVVIPLPAALPLYGTGLAVMGLIGWRRKRKAAARA